MSKGIEIGGETICVENRNSGKFKKLITNEKFRCRVCWKPITQEKFIHLNGQQNNYHLSCYFAEIEKQLKKRRRIRLYLMRYNKYIMLEKLKGL